MPCNTRGGMWLVLLVSVILVLGLCQVCSAENLVTVNPGFETTLTTLSLGGGDHTDVNGGWNYHMVGAYGVYLMSENKGGLPRLYHSGSNALRLAPKGAGSELLVSVWQDIDVVPGAEYTASVWMMTGNRFAVGGNPDLAGLWIQELDADGNVIVGETRVLGESFIAVDYQVLDYIQLSKSFTTNAATRKVRFMIHTATWFAYVDGNGCIRFDDCVLDGPVVTGEVAGRVTTGGGTPVPDAEVAVGGVTGSSDLDGYYTITGVPLSDTAVSIRCSKDGYYAQSKWRAIPASSSVALDFDLVAVGNNLLTNAGFDDCASQTSTVVPDGWIAGTAGTVEKESYWLQYLPAYTRSGEEAAFLKTTTEPQEVTLSQQVPVQPDSDYTAKSWIRAVPGASWYSGSDQKAGILVQVYDRAGSLLNEYIEYLTNFSDWQQVSKSFNTGPTGRIVKISCWANMVDIYGMNFDYARAVFDDVELNGPAGDPLPPLYGVVKDRSTDAGIAGAYVELLDTAYNTITEADGYWEMSPPPASYTVRAGAGDDYYVERTSRTSPHADHIIFNLEPTDGNLLGDAGYDDFVPSGSSWWSRIWESNERYRIGITRVRDERSWAGTNSPITVNTEYNAVALINYTATPGYATTYQRVPVIANTEYSASAQFKPSWVPGSSHSWGTDPSQYAHLVIREYDAAGNLVLDHPVEGAMQSQLTDLTSWETLSKTFTTQATTAFVEVGGYAWLVDRFTLARSRAVFDTFKLIGPAGAFSLSGTVTGGGGPIAGAVVEVTDISSSPYTVYTTTTDTNGVYTVLGAKLAHEYCVRVAKPGYYTMRKYAVTNGNIALDFNLQSLNLLFNAGFDDTDAGWGRVTVSATIRSEVYGRLNLPGYYDTGEDAMSIYVVGGNQSGQIYQEIPVQGGQAYSASTRFHAAWLDGTTVVWGTNPAQLARLFVQEYDAAGNAVGAEKQAAATLADLGSWETLSLDFTTAPETAKVRVGGYAYIVDNYNANLSRAVFDTFSLTGPAGISATIGALKSQDDGTGAVMLGKVVTASFDGFFYVEEPDRSSGIKVDGSAAPGEVVDVSGTIDTVDGERIITGALIQRRGAGFIPGPLGVNNKATDTGLSAVGLYVTLWGRVDSVGIGFFTMTDGSGASIKVYGSATANDYVKVTGALGAEGDPAVPVLRAVTVTKMD